MEAENQIVLKADGGKVLTNGETFGNVVYLAPSDNANNWHEITIEEYEQIMAGIGGDTDAVE